MTITMLKLVTGNYQDLTVTFTEDGWFNATTVAERFGKEPYYWLRQRETVEYVVALTKSKSLNLFNPDFLEELNRINMLDGSSSRSQGRLLALVKKTKLVKVKVGAPETGGGTWLHPKLAVPFARWLDINFAVWCDDQIDTLIRGNHPHFDVKRMRHAASSSYKIMNQMLQMTRQQAGKEIVPHHFSNEARLINWALTGEFKEIDRDALPYGELDLLAKLEAFNTMLIGTGLDYEARKKALQNFSAKWRSSRTPALAEVA